MFKTMRGKVIRWRRKEESLIHEKNFGEWMYYGTADQAWGLEEYLELPAAVPVRIADTAYFRDPRGYYHKTIRDCFSEFRLKRSPREGNTIHIERMHKALREIADGLHRTNPEEMIRSTFEGSRGFFEEYMTYLELEQIIATDGPDIADFELTVEGKSILLMLRKSDPESGYDCSPAATMRYLMQNHPDRFKDRFKDLDW